MPYIAIVARESRVRELEAYRYAGIRETGIDVPHYNSDMRVVVWTGVDEDLAQQQADRLSSGLFGARVCSHAEFYEFRDEVAP